MTLNFLWKNTKNTIPFNNKTIVSPCFHSVNEFFQHMSRKMVEEFFKSDSIPLPLLNCRKNFWRQVPWHSLFCLSELSLLFWKIATNPPQQLGLASTFSSLLCFTWQNFIGTFPKIFSPLIFQNQAIFSAESISLYFRTDEKIINRNVI